MYVYRKGIIIYGVIFESFVFRLLKSYPGIRLNSYSWVSSFHVAVYSTQRLLRGGPFGKDHGDGRRWPGNGKLYGQRGENRPEPLCLPLRLRPPRPSDRKTVAGRGARILRLRR